MGEVFFANGCGKRLSQIPGLPNFDMLFKTMLFVIKKAIEPFLVPPGIFVAVLIISGLLIFKKTKAGVFNIFIGLLIWAMSIMPVSDALMRGLEKGLAIPAQPHGDVIIVLGAGMAGNGPSEDTKTRLLAAVKLYRLIRTPIIVSAGAGQGIMAEAPADGRELIALGVPQQKIILEDKSRDTLENAMYSKKICRQYGFKAPVVVTSAVHMKRALRSFRFEKMEVSYFPASAPVGRRAYNWQEYLPGSMDNSARALHEYLGLVYLKMLEKTGLQKPV